MYWVVLACVLLAESWFAWILIWYGHSLLLPLFQIEPNIPTTS